MAQFDSNSITKIFIFAQKDVPTIQLFSSGINDTILMSGLTPVIGGENDRRTVFERRPTVALLCAATADTAASHVVWSSPQLVRRLLKHFPRCVLVGDPSMVQIA